MACPTTMLKETEEYLAATRNINQFPTKALLYPSIQQKTPSNQKTQPLAARKFTVSPTKKSKNINIIQHPKHLQ